jgi:DNA gyrase inhibitor GyrI
MSELDVKFIELKSMMVASSYAFGDSPEVEAWEILEQWARPKGYLDDLEKNPLFGFSNPCPKNPGDKYAHEFWLQVEYGEVPTSDIRIGEFHGGPYVVTRCDVMDGNFGKIHTTWEALASVCKQKGYQWGYRPGLEKTITIGDPNGFILDLYYPLRNP